ncbi:MAG: type I-C CRISPR-associated protein Cas8c/Csd1 [Chloroflexales bacterium]|nr:type I-C CRISPR-associated protein Cas8c/Csd1 [Chloroflexales bacterium]
MLLQRLKEYADWRMELPPVLYNEAPVRYIIELDGNGRLLSPRPTDTADPSNPKTKRGQRRLVPQIQRTADIKPLLLADKADYTLGLGGEGAKPERVKQCHAAYLDLLSRCAEQTQAPEVAAVLRFLQETPAEQLELTDDFNYGELITFRVHDRFVVDLPAVQSFWAALNAPADDVATVMQCIVCGRQRPVLDRLQGKIKGVPGGQTSGTAIISANAEAFESYGLEASLIAPTCADCGEHFTKAANHLLSDQSSRIILGGSAFIFWTRDDVGFDLLTFMNDPQPEAVRALLESPRSGKQSAEVDDTAFYATTLSGSGARVVVRDWIDTTVGVVQTNLRWWFAWQRIVGQSGEEPKPLGLFPLAVATVREAKDIVPTTPRTLLRTALTGAPLPWGLLFQAVRRNRAEQKVTPQRAALIKLVFASRQSGQQEDCMVHLDPANDNPAYRCGRLLAVLEDIQRVAIPGAKATIVDRFFGTASSAPASVFGRLMRGAQPHLSKLERDNPNAYYALQRRLEEVTTGLNSFPRTLTLEEQGLFSLGYYHQRAHQRAEAIAASARKKAAAAEAAPTNDDGSAQ